MKAETTVPPRLRLRLFPAAESHVRRQHPWVFASSIKESNRSGTTGEVAVIYDRQDRFLGLGLFDADSPIRVRMLHCGKPVNLDDVWWLKRLDAALDRRRGMFETSTTGYRWIHGESDGWPGLVLDRFDQVLVLKLYTASWFPRLSWIVQALQERLTPAAIVLRLSRNIEVQARMQGLEDGSVIAGSLPHAGGRIWFRENGLQFEADVLRGQKTGFFLDQRENRCRVEALSRGRRVLNAFSFTGGFSIYAARGGARSVTSLDISAHALAGADRLFEKNRQEGLISDCLHQGVQADAFDWIAAAPPSSFDLIVLDPPSLAKREAERDGALTAYRHLVRAAVRLLAPGGELVAASCSAHVQAEEFFAAVRSSAQGGGRRLQERERTQHPADHPSGFPEAAYLKCIYLTDGNIHAG